MKRAEKAGLEVWLLGTIATLLAAWWIWKKWHEPGAAMALVIASPFPCPPGLPC